MVVGYHPLASEKKPHDGSSSTVNGVRRLGAAVVFDGASLSGDSPRAQRSTLYDFLPAVLPQPTLIDALDVESLDLKGRSGASPSSEMEIISMDDASRVVSKSHDGIFLACAFIDFML